MLHSVNQYHYRTVPNRGQGSLVGITKGYGLDGPGNATGYGLHGPGISTGYGLHGSGVATG